ncbi:MAG: hypothetical protein U1F43_37740 [Myxococcota bacterium]
MRDRLLHLRRRRTRRRAPLQQDLHRQLSARLEECRPAPGRRRRPVFLCQPAINTLCLPCETNSNCQALAAALCVQYDDSSSPARTARTTRPRAARPTTSARTSTTSSARPSATSACRRPGSCQCPDGTDYDNDPDNSRLLPTPAPTTAASPAAEGDCYARAARRPRRQQEDVDGCEYACNKTGDDDWPDAQCNGSDCDQNCDGIDGDWNRAVFVSAAVAVSGSGAPYDPVKSIGEGITVAQQTGKDHVYVAAGTYIETVTMVTGISVFGGYSSDGKWVRNLATQTTTVTSSSGTQSVRVVIADGIDGQRTVFDGFNVVAGTNANPSGSSYAIWVRSSSGRSRSPTCPRSAARAAAARPRAGSRQRRRGRHQGRLERREQRQHHRHLHRLRDQRAPVQHLRWTRRSGAPDQCPGGINSAGGAGSRRLEQ